MQMLFDYGHGGNDPGAVYQSRKEAEDVLKIGQAIAKNLRAKGLIIDETRTSNHTTLSLEKRVQIEKQKPYDYFISFHRNAFKPETSSGTEVYIFSPNSKAKPLATALQKAFVQMGFKDRGIKTSGFYVLKHTKAPAMLLEMGFIDNSKDNELFDKQFNNMATALSNTILQYTLDHSTITL